MPFATEFWAAMELPFPGDVLGGFEVELIDVQHQGVGDGRYEYPVRIVLKGKGGKQGVRSALRALFNARRTTFSEYGNPYHCWLGRPDVERLGNERYEVRARGTGVRIYLQEELLRFCRYLESEGVSTKGAPLLTELLGIYMERYIAGVARACDVYRRKIRSYAGGK